MLWKGKWLYWCIHLKNFFFKRKDLTAFCPCCIYRKSPDFFKKQSWLYSLPVYLHISVFKWKVKNEWSTWSNHEGGRMIHLSSLSIITLDSYSTRTETENQQMLRATFNTLSQSFLNCHGNSSVFFFSSRANSIKHVSPCPWVFYFLLIHHNLLKKIEK